MEKKYIYIILFSFLLVSCEKYLSVEPKGKVIPSTVEDYHLLLAPITDLKIEEELFLTADDFTASKTKLGDLTDPNNKAFHLYTFSNVRFANPDIEINAWNNPYANLYVYNKVVNEIDNAKESLGFSPEDRKRIKAEALYGRAVQYFFLINLFAKHYDKKTAASDKGVPMVLEAKTYQKAPNSSSIAEVYDLIISDLNQAIPNLPKQRVEFNRPSKGSGYALLSRVYLYQANYDLALKNAELALAENDKITDYTTLDYEPEIVNAAYNAEQYSQLYFSGTNGFAQGYVSPDLDEIFEPGIDTRLVVFIGCDWIFDEETQEWIEDCSKKSNAFAITPNPLPSIPEMYLTAAECYARTNKPQQAIDKLNKLRKNRLWVVEELTAESFATPDELLKFALAERRRELFMGGTRLFDIKRLNLDPRFAKTVKHTLDTEIYEAAPNSDKLVMPIPAQVKKFNPNL